MCVQCSVGLPGKVWSYLVVSTQQVTVVNMLLPPLLVLATTTQWLLAEDVEVETMEEVEEVTVAHPVRLAGGLVVTALKRPEKCVREATPGDRLTVHYTGRFDDADGEVFDTNLKPGKPPYRFQLGAGRVIQGYERGVPGMCKGEVRTLQVPPAMAYGEHGVPGKIPGNSTLHFTVELLSIEDGVLPPPPPPPKQKVYNKNNLSI